MALYYSCGYGHWRIFTAGCGRALGPAHELPKESTFATKLIQVMTVRSSGLPAFTFSSAQKISAVKTDSSSPS